MGYEITPALRPAAEDLIRDQFVPRTGGLIVLEGKQAQTDYLAHIDLICSSVKTRRYLNISDEPVLETHTLSMDWKCASFQNWNREYWHTAPFSEPLMDHGQNTTITWIYESESGDKIDGWITALWNRELSVQLHKNWDRYKTCSIVHKSARVEGGNFWYLSLYDLLTFFRRFVIGYDLTVLKSHLKLPILERRITFTT